MYVNILIEILVNM